MGVMVHGIIDDATVPMLSATALLTAAGRPVRFVRSEDLAGVVTDTDGEVFPTRGNLSMHTRLLEAVSQATTVLPMRFGTVVPDEAALERDYLEVRRSRLRSSLERLRGFVELRVRAFYIEDEVVRAVLDSDRDAAALRGREDLEAKVVLGQRVSDGIDLRRGQDAQLVLEALEPFAADASTASPTSVLDVVTVSFLVATDQNEAFGAAVDQLAGRLAPVAGLELVGPMPPFSFTGEDR